MKLTEQQLFDYMHCPAYFDMKHLRQVPLDEGLSLAKMLDIVAKYFYLNLLNGQIKSTSELKKKWDSVCQKYEGQISNKQIMEGMGLVMKLYQWASDERAVVLDINTPYTIHVDGVDIVGNMGTVLAAPNGKYELLITDFSSRLPDQGLIDMKLKYTLEAYAFHKVYNKFASGIRIHSVKHNKDFFTTRTDGDFKRLETMIRNIGRSVDGGLYYPREGMCSTCPAKTYCRFWSYDNEGDE